MEMSLGELVRYLILAAGIGGIGYWAGRRRAERNKKVSDALRKPAV
jgi:hypothetical protein